MKKIFLILLFSALILSTFTDAKEFERKNPKSYRIEFGDVAKNFGPRDIKFLEVFIAVPHSNYSQKIHSITFYPEPTSFLYDEWGQKIAYFKVENLKKGEYFAVRMVVDVTLYDVDFKINPERVGFLEDIPQEIRERYLQNTDMYSLNSSIIKEASKKAIGDEKNPYYMVKNIHDYVAKTLSYELDSMWLNASQTLKMKKGSCSEYTFLFISLCRINGIPARYVGGSFAESNCKVCWESTGHRWVEVYLPNYGWVPVDVTFDDEEGSYIYFGKMKNDHFIYYTGGGPSKYLGWSYNSYHRFKATRNANLYVDSVSTWIEIDRDFENIQEDATLIFDMAKREFENENYLEAIKLFEKAREAFAERGENLKISECEIYLEKIAEGEVLEKREEGGMGIFVFFLEFFMVYVILNGRRKRDTKTL